jgi:hypothetical protein
VLASFLLVEKTPGMAHEVNVYMGSTDEEDKGREGHFFSADDLNNHTGVGGNLNLNLSTFKSPLTHLINSHKMAKVVLSGIEEEASLLAVSLLNSELPVRLANPLKDGGIGSQNLVATVSGISLPVRSTGGEFFLDSVQEGLRKLSMLDRETPGFSTGFT